MTYLELVIGLVLLAVGADLLVRGAAAVARKLDVPPLAIGVFVIGFGTSVPELVTSITAAISAAPAISIGNIVGANIADILLVLGAAGAIHAVPVDEVMLGRNGLVLALSTGLLVLAAELGLIDRPMGALWVAMFGFFAWQTYRVERRRRRLVRIEALDQATPLAPRMPVAGSVVLALIGILVLVGGADLTVGGATAIAAGLGIPEAIIGVTVVAIGTTLPELLTTVVAAGRGESELAVGNVVGSCIFNILAILGLTALVHPLPVPAETTAIDIWVLVAAVVALLVFGFTGRRVGRLEGVGFLFAYAAFLAAQAVIAFSAPT